MTRCTSVLRGHLQQHEAPDLSNLNNSGCFCRSANWKAACQHGIRLLNAVCSGRMRTALSNVRLMAFRWRSLSCHTWLQAAHGRCSQLGMNL